jgi:hypothetical protein
VNSRISLYNCIKASYYNEVALKKEAKKTSFRG